MSGKEPNDGGACEESFESMFEASLTRRDNFDIGDEVSGRVVYVTGESVFVDIAGKSEAVIDSKEFLSEDGALRVRTGDTIRAYVVSIQRGEIRLTTTIGRSAASPALIEKARSMGIPVEGTVTGTTKGGYAVSLGGISCFCPFSQIDVKSPQNPESMVGRSLLFKVTQYGEKGRNIVLSRRTLLEERSREAEKELRASLHEGDLIAGKVSSIQKFGVFVDIGGFEALVPRSELSWSRSADPNSFSPGNSVEAKVLSIDWEGRRIVLSIKQAGPEPWDSISGYEVGQERNGRIVNIIRNGAFVELEPGIEGFIPVSRMSQTKRVNKPEDVVSRGDAVSVRIIEILPEKKKMTLELRTGEADPWQEPLDQLREEILVAFVESARPGGVTVRLASGMLGYIAREECLVKKGTDLQEAYPAGKEVKVVVKIIDKENRRLHLSEADALRREERREFEQYMTAGEGGSADGSSFGRLFKQKFDEIQRKKNA